LAQSAATRLSRMFAVGDLGGLRALLVKLSMLGVLIVAVGCPIALLAGRPLLTLLYRREYGDHAGLLAILVTAAGIGTIGSFIFCGVSAARSFRPQVPVYALAAVVCAVGSLMLTPRFGADGAAVALLVSALVIVGGGLWVLWSAMRARAHYIPSESSTMDAESLAVISDRRPTVTLVAPHDGHYFLVDRLIDAYRSFGYLVEFVGWDRTRKYSELVVENDVVYRYLLRGWGYANWRLLFALPIWTLRLALDVMTRRTSLVHAVDFDGAFGVALGLRLRSEPFLYDIQDNFELRHNFPLPLRWLIGRLNAFVVNRSARTIVVGDERITGSLRQLRGKIAIIPNCPPDVPPPTDLVRDSSTLSLASVGRIAEQRGILMLLEACRRLAWLRVEMAGVVETAAMAQAIAACPQVSLHGYMPQAKALELVHRADLCFAFYDPSTQICRLANGAKWYDAMMAGKPVFTNTEVVASEWMVREGFCYAVPYSDLEGFVQTLTRIHADRKDLLHKGTRARELYETQFNRKAMDRRLHDVVELACGTRMR
jgi:glycosyltransferase involved in cell wall biosynthesis